MSSLGLYSLLDQVGLTIPENRRACFNRINRSLGLYGLLDQVGLTILESPHHLSGFKIAGFTVRQAVLIA